MLLQQLRMRKQKSQLKANLIAHAEGFKVNMGKNNQSWTSIDHSKRDCKELPRISTSQHTPISRFWKLLRLVKIKKRGGELMRAVKNNVNWKLGHSVKTSLSINSSNWLRYWVGSVDFKFQIEGKTALISNWRRLKTWPGWRHVISKAKMDTRCRTPLWCNHNHQLQGKKWVDVSPLSFYRDLSRWSNTSVQISARSYPFRFDAIFHFRDLFKTLSSFLREVYRIEIS